MRSRNSSRPPSSAMISIFVPPRSIPMRMSQTGFAESGGDEVVSLKPALGAKMGVLRCRQQWLQAFIADQMDARHVRRFLGRRRQVLRYVVDEKGRPPRASRQRANRLTLQSGIGDYRKVETKAF